MFETWVFYGFAAVLLLSGVLVITARNPVHGVLFLVLALVVGGIMVIEMVAVLANRYYGAVPRELPAGYSNTKALGRVLYTEYAYAFEIAAVILLVAIIAAIALTLRRRKDTRGYRPAEQLSARREDRVRLVTMPVER